MKMNTPSRFFFLSLLAICFTSLALGDAPRLPQDEVEALKDIAETVGMKDWNFSTNPCSVQPNWVNNRVSCNCSVSNDNLCHVTSIVLRKQNLQGRLPPELIRLPYLQEIKLTNNYLSGTIPKEWGSMNLVKIYLYGNRLSGSIPVEITNISTLQYLSIGNNNFSGNLPPELGNLTRLNVLLLESNKFIGELPKTFSRLTALQAAKFSDNQFSGSIPNFIQRWTSLEILYISGSGLSGPIPSGISFLQNLTDLIITDLNGPDSTFPPIKNLRSLDTLVLRSCNINDTLPEYLGEFTTLSKLDLSYNKLRGGIPGTFESLRAVGYIYLTGNLLTGPVPKWIETAKSIDLSYNNFSNENSEPMTCKGPNMNLFGSFAKRNNSGPLSCGKSKDTCPKNFYSFHINCGGEKVRIGSTTYDEDTEVRSTISKKIGENWALSNTGDSPDGYQQQQQYQMLATNHSRLYTSDAEAELYMNARVSPISLTYYGFCLANGNYTVKLHFAEIIITDDNTFSSLGRRIFDVYIQGKRVLKDFNIKNEAQGVGKKLMKTFPTYVNSNDLEIRFYWAGKGDSYNSYLPSGSLISAISVASDFPTPSKRMSIGVVIGFVVAIVMVMIILVVSLLGLRRCLKKRNTLAQELKNLEPQTGLFTLRQIKTATNNFDINNMIGEGGFGAVFKGTLLDGTTIAVKQLSSKSRQGNREFINEIGMISALQHLHLVKLYGCCVDGDQLLLVYEYMENNSLARALFGHDATRLKLNWATRHKICVGIAKGLAFLHEESRLKIVHRDIKATNVLLDKDLNPKISDFGLAKLNEEENTHISTRVAGTYGYMAPEYAMHGYLTNKADVYSFGIVVLEIVSGMSNTIHRPKDEALYLLNWAQLLKEKGNLIELVDPRLGSDFNEEEAMVMINVALLCTNVSSNLRPSMSSVVSMLEGRTVVPEFVSDTSEVTNDNKMEAMRQYYYQIYENKISETQTQSQSLSIDGTWTTSSSSTANPYPLQHDSSYLGKK